MVKTVIQLPFFFSSFFLGGAKVAGVSFGTSSIVED
jgi:hypothetical protein